MRARLSLTPKRTLVLNGSLYQVLINAQTGQVAV
jgi:hypothetical protein